MGKEKVIKILNNITVTNYFITFLRVILRYPYIFLVGTVPAKIRTIDFTCSNPNRYFILMKNLQPFKRV